MPNPSTQPKQVISDKYRSRYDDDLSIVTASLDRGLSGTSDVVSEYEAALGRYFSSSNAIAISSGGAAISVALEAAGVKPGDEVVLTPTCPLCTVYPIMAAGAKPVFVDTRVDGFGADPADLDRVLSPKTRAIIDIPMWGYPTQVDELQKIARKVGVPLILDLAHSHGSTLHGRPLSAYGDLSCFSTHERKPLATGEGGFILTDNNDLAKRCRDYSRFGNLNGRDFGLNFKLGALAAALGTSRLQHLDRQLEARRKNAERFLSKLSHPSVRESTLIPGGKTNYYFLTLRTSFANNRRFIDYLDENGVPSDIKRYGCKCLYEFPAVAQYRRNCPNGERLLNTMTTIPVHPALTEKDMDYMAGLINAYREG
ncbi:DegT/DnrJ/EryC1/StrS aminotransferase family protein [Vitiosangium sp. GDMCC 1.1324]|uniref:DegT/DnrJ/EryC1/StrS family aminotransferase n=1 Tax=Vitiosangium sp. (strain GDMCC 1.1324) TaxID=2138576 RepID=UPI000D36DB03|nr:aminotransferase class I/II-fold pyridoxal phosphate-dependent enzyme [Vitiosangium sp. GDMCC 1.1324]PTL84526.1 aspartate aminotransferase [Vitiosangium sp. GDMCC 1.1324]